VSCDAFLERVAALLDGRLTPFDREELLEHLDICAECRGLHAALAAAGDAPEDPDLSEAIWHGRAGPRAAARGRGSARGSTASWTPSRPTS